MWRILKEKWWCNFTLYQKRCYRGTLTSKKLTRINFLNAMWLFWRKLIFYSVVMLFLANTASVLILFNTLGILLQFSLCLYIYTHYPMKSTPQSKIFIPAICSKWSNFENKSVFSPIWNWLIFLEICIYTECNFLFIYIEESSSSSCYNKKEPSALYSLSK